MKYFYIFKDGQIQGRTATEPQAIAMIRSLQKLETHYMLKAEFTIIEGSEEKTIKYE